MREDTQNCINEFQIKTFGNVKNIERAETLINNDEVVKYIAPTNVVTTSSTTLKKEKLPCVIILTDKRIMFNFQALNNNHAEIFSVNEIRSIESTGNSLTGGHIIIHTLSKDFDFLVAYKKEIMVNIQSTFDSVRSKCNSDSNSIIQSSNTSDADEILKFKKLLDDRIITQEEFDLKKKQLLGL